MLRDNLCGTDTQNHSEREAHDPRNQEAVLSSAFGGVLRVWGGLFEQPGNRNHQRHRRDIHRDGRWVDSDWWEYVGSRRGHDCHWGKRNWWEHGERRRHHGRDWREFKGSGGHHLRDKRKRD